MNAVFDTVLLIDYLNRVPQAGREFDRYGRITISIITWIEVMAGVRTAAEDTLAREFLQTFNVHDVNVAVADRAAKIRRSSRIRVPDAVIWATALELGELLVTRNTKDFPSDDPGVRIPYTI
ncbi:MAG: type II toxin-antitoxin system VapC family toxin [Gemmatimonadaceae bacterium]